MSEDAPTPDQIAGAPHPRDTERLIGQGAAEAAFLDAFTTGRLHHGWLLTGPRGVGKATLAWAIARFLLATPDPEEGGLFGAPPPVDTLHIAPDHPVATRIQAGSEPGLYHIRRRVNPDTGRLRPMIVAEDVRDLGRFLHLSATDGGRRVVLIDSADEMNVQAANALLKMLEEPPERTTLLLISHQPARLLPTIRSRCRELRLAPLDPGDMQLALAQAGIEIGNSDALSALAAGSVGEAVRLSNLGGLAIYSELIAILASLPNLDRPRALKLAEAAATRGAEDRLDLLITLIDLALSRLARAGATGQAPQYPVTRDEAATFARLAPTPARARDWAQIAQEIGTRARHGRAVNLDPAALVLDTIFRLQQTAAT